MSASHKGILAILIVGLLGGAGPLAFAQMDLVFTYQGQLKMNGEPVTGPVDFRFSLWNAVTGGSQLGFSYVTPTPVDVVDGLFTVSVDAANFGPNGFNGEARWLRIDVDDGGWVELTPRQPVTPAPYALYALNSGGEDPCLWSEDGGDIYRESGEVGIGTDNPFAPLHVEANDGIEAVLFNNTAAGPGGNGLTSETSASYASGVLGRNTAGSGEATGVQGVVWNANGWGVRGDNGSASGSAIGVFGLSSSPNGMGVRGRANSSSGTNYGVYGMSDSTSGYGVYGDAPAGGRGVAGYAGSDNYGYLGWSQGGVYGRSTDGYGVRGYSVNDWGVFGSVPIGSTQAGIVGAITLSTGAIQWVPESGVCGSSEDGYGVSGRVDGGYAVYGTHDDTGNFGYLATPNEGAYGEHDATGNFGQLGSAVAGVHGESSVPGNYAVCGLHTAAGNDTPAVSGEHAVSDYYGIGVKGVGGYVGVDGRVAPTGSDYYYGVYGYVNGGTGNNHAVYGYAGGGGTNYAGYFAGNVHCTGTLSKGGGTFKIDHPLDPENKYLQHSFVESPDMLNIYNGNVVLNGKGEAVVTMPEWFEALNMEFRYQLTCIGGFAQVYIAEEIANNQFKIAGGKPGLKVSWQVTGMRQDPFANANRVQVEVDKPANERGTYLHPEAWGQPQELQVDCVREAREAEAKATRAEANAQ